MSQNVKDFLWAFGWSTVTAIIGASIAICVAPKIQAKFCKKNEVPDNGDKTPEKTGTETEG